MIHGNENRVELLVGTTMHVIKGYRDTGLYCCGRRSYLYKKYTKSNTILAGVPAKVVKRDINWDRERLSVNWK